MKGDETACKKLLQYQHWLVLSLADRFCQLNRSSIYLGTLLKDVNNPVNRFLVADIVRELVCHGVERKRLFGQDVAEQTVLSFPIEHTWSATWLGSASRFFDDLDASLPSRDRSVYAA